MTDLRKHKEIFSYAKKRKIEKKSIDKININHFSHKDLLEKIPRY